MKKQYRFRPNRPGRPAWTLEVYSFYPDLPPGAMGRGPYCCGWINVKAKDYVAAVASLQAQGYTPLETGGGE